MITDMGQKNSFEAFSRYEEDGRPNIQENYNNLLLVVNDAAEQTLGKKKSFSLPS